MRLTGTGTGSARKKLAMVAVGIAVAGVATVASASATAPPRVQTSTTITSTGLKAGQVKHVWLIILENKSYDATFTGLNQNSYLWKTLPSQGVLLKNYYGTGHSSQDNYMSLVSGQAPEQDTQSDCSVADTDFGTQRHASSRPAATTAARSPRRRTRPAQRCQRAERGERLHLPDRRADAVQPARRGRQDLEGLRAGPRATSPAVRTRSAAARARRPTTRPRTRRS